MVGKRLVLLRNNGRKIADGLDSNSNINYLDHPSIPQQNKDHPIYFSLLLLVVVDVVAVDVDVGPKKKEAGIIQIYCITE